MHRLFHAYSEHALKEESFLSFTRRHDIDELNGSASLGASMMTKSTAALESLDSGQCSVQPEQITWLNGFLAGLYSNTSAGAQKALPH